MVPKYLYLNYTPSDIPKFEDEKTIQNVSMSIFSGLSSSYYMSSMIINYEISAKNYFADKIKLISQYKIVSLSTKQGTTEYLGLATTRSANIFCNFACIVEYNSLPNEIIVVLDTNNQFLLGE